MSVEEYNPSETQEFDEITRTFVTIFLMFVVLFIIAYIIVTLIKKNQYQDISYISKNDDYTYRFAMLSSCFAICVIIASVLLLPFSIISNDIIVRYPGNYFLQWINKSLIQHLWNSVSFSSNCTIFLLPFASIFLDSEGFSGWKNGLKNRLLETLIFFTFTLLAIFGIVVLIAAPFRDKYLIDTIESLWGFSVPMLYSVGVILINILAPLGSVEIVIAYLQNLHQFLTISMMNVDPDIIDMEINNINHKLEISEFKHFYNSISVSDLRQRKNSLQSQLEKSKLSVKLIVKLGLLTIYMLLLILLIFTVVMNTLGIIVGLQTLPKSRADIDIGKKPSSWFGWIGSTFQIILIEMLLISGIRGLVYYLPFRLIKWKLKANDIYKLLHVLWLISLLTSAVPIQSRLLGITAFNPLGTYGQFDWLDSVFLVLAYNVSFLCLEAIFLTRRVLIDRQQHFVTLASSYRQIYSLFIKWISPWSSLQRS